MYQRRIAELSINDSIINELNNQEFRNNNNGEPQIIEDTPALNELENTDISHNDYLIQKAIRLGNNVDEILENIEAGGR